MRSRTRSTSNIERASVRSTSFVDLANKATDPDEKAALKDAADALGGALYRQHLMQRDLDGLVNYLYASDMMASDDDTTRDPDAPRRQFLQDVPGAHPINGSSPVWTPYDIPLAGTESLTDDITLARAASQDFMTRLPAVRNDERTAVPRIEAAADKC